jgi:hypothetical protein
VQKLDSCPTVGKPLLGRNQKAMFVLPLPESRNIEKPFRGRNQKQCRPFLSETGRSSNQFKSTLNFSKNLGFLVQNLKVLCIHMDLAESGTVVEIDSLYQRGEARRFSYIVPSNFYVVSLLFI